MPRGWSKYKEGTPAYNRLHGDPQKERKKPLSQVQAEQRKEVENKKKKFTEFLSVMMAKGKKVKDQAWNESFNDFVPTDQTKSRRERKREEKLKKEQKDQEMQEQKDSEDNKLKVTKEEVITNDEGVTIVKKEIHKKSTKLGAQKSEQVHIKFGQKADISKALKEVEEEIPEEKVEETHDEKQDEGEESDGVEIDENRLYVMNLPFEVTEDEIREYFGAFGEIDEISLPKRRGGLGTGF